MSEKVKMRIGELLHERGISMNKFARRVDLATTSVRKWVVGESLPSAAMLPRIARELNCTIDELYEREEK